jgi:hypothetical protein
MKRAQKAISNNVQFHIPNKIDIGDEEGIMNYQPNQPNQPIQNVEPIQTQPVKKSKPSSKANMQKARETRMSKILEKKKADAEKYLKSIDERNFEDDNSDVEVITIKTSKVKKNVKHDTDHIPVPVSEPPKQHVMTDVEKLIQENRMLMEKLQAQSVTVSPPKQKEPEIIPLPSPMPQNKTLNQYAKNNYPDVDMMVRAMKSKIINFK